MATSVNRMMLTLFYQLRKEYPADIQLVKVLKGEVDPETGKVTDPTRTIDLKAVISPMWVTQDILSRLAGKIERIQSVFLVQVSDLQGIEITTNDYFTHNERRYQNLNYEDFDGVLIALYGETTK